MKFEKGGKEKLFYGLNIRRQWMDGGRFSRETSIMGLGKADVRPAYGSDGRMGPRNAQTRGMRRTEDCSAEQEFG